jgi:hypothetical protein
MSQVLAHNADSPDAPKADAIGGRADMVAFELIRRS